MDSYSYRIIPIAERHGVLAEQKALRPGERLWVITTAMYGALYAERATPFRSRFRGKSKTRGEHR